MGLAAASFALRSHRRTVLSALPVTSQWLSGLIATALTAPLWPRSTMGLAAVSFALRSHRRAVLSALPVTDQWLSGLIPTALTSSSWPRSTMGLAAVSFALRSHRRAVLSKLPGHQPVVIRADPHRIYRAFVAAQYHG